MSARTALLTALAAAAVLAVGVLTPLPSPAQVRDWAAGAGWATPVLFLLAYAVLTVVPIPRTVFNLSAGLLLGQALGVAVAMAATAIAAAVAFLLARGVARRWIAHHLDRGVLRAVNGRLTRGGAMAVVSLRLIPMIPFAPVNYCCGLSAIRLRPYLAGTLVGSLPGTAAAVLLGDALTGTTPPALVAVYGVLAVAGGVGLYAVLRRTRPELVERPE